MSDISKYQHVELWNCSDKDDLKNCCIDIAEEFLGYARNIDLLAITQSNERIIDTIYTCLGRHMFGVDVWNDKELNEVLYSRLRHIQEDYRIREMTREKDE